MKQTTFYIDGFNFYYGLKRSMTVDKKWGNAYWIDLVKLCSGFIAPDEKLKKVVYFTAKPLGTSKSSRQQAFLNSNKFVNNNTFEVIKGKYLEKHIECPYCKADISRPEEKKTDVNISIRMISDCIHANTDVVVLVSADTDLIPPLELIKNDFPNIKIRVCFPPSNYSHDIVDTLNNWKIKPTLMNKSYRRFENAIMPDTIANGKYIIPPEWKIKQYK